MTSAPTTNIFLSSLPNKSTIHVQTQLINKNKYTARITNWPENLIIESILRPTSIKTPTNQRDPIDVKACHQSLDNQVKNHTLFIQYFPMKQPRSSCDKYLLSDFCSNLLTKWKSNSEKFENISTSMIQK